MIKVIFRVAGDEKSSFEAQSTCPTTMTEVEKTIVVMFYHPYSKLM